MDVEIKRCYLVGVRRLGTRVMLYEKRILMAEREVGGGRSSVYSLLPKEVKSRMAWSKGLTKENDERIERQAKKMRKRKTTDSEKNKKLAYKEACKFDLGGDISKVVGYELLEIYGMFHKIKNRGGVVRDHRISINHGYMMNIPSSIIGHPANCRFLLSADNAKKSFLSEITIEQLIQEIEKW